MTKKMECGCIIEWPSQNNHAAQGEARRNHRATCPLFSALHQLRKAREEVKRLEQNVAHLQVVRDAGGEDAYTHQQMRILDEEVEQEQIDAAEDGVYLTEEEALEQVYMRSHV